MRLGCSVASFCSMLWATFMRASLGFLLFHVLGEEQALPDHEGQHQAHAAEQLEVDPGVGREVEGDIEVEKAHAGKKSGPTEIQLSPGLLGQLDLLPQHGAYQVLMKQQLARAQYGGEQPVQHRRLPFDEGLVVQQQGGAAEHDDDGQACLLYTS